MAATLLMAAAAVPFLAAPTTAQRERTRIIINGREVEPYDLVLSRRARIGVTLDMRAVDNDSVGATIASVTPGGPAARAGLQSGDIITRFNGRSLVPSSRDRSDEAESLAALRLIEMVARLDPGDTVTVEYRRGRNVSTATIVTSAEADLGGFSFRLPEQTLEPEARFRMLPEIWREPGGFAFSFGGPLAQIELAPLNQDLGAYFGTSEGVLVIDAPTGNTFGLKGGDVILTVDGRRATRPSTLHRILGTYEQGESVKLEIMRNRTRQTIMAKIERDER